MSLETHHEQDGGSHEHHALAPGYDLPLSVNKSSHPSFIYKHTAIHIVTYCSETTAPLSATTQELNHAANINNTQT